MVIDTEGYIIASESSSTPAQGWSSFDNAIEVAMTGTINDMAELRSFGVQEVDTSMLGIIFLGAMLSILVLLTVRIPSPSGLHLILSRSRRKRRRISRVGQVERQNAGPSSNWNPFWPWDVDILRFHRHNRMDYGAEFLRLQELSMTSRFSSRPYCSSSASSCSPVERVT